jgi:hypothetical protein
MNIPFAKYSMNWSLLHSEKLGNLYVIHVKKTNYIPNSLKFNSLAFKEGILMDSDLPSNHSKKKVGLPSLLYKPNKNIRKWLI